MIGWSPPQKTQDGYTGTSAKCWLKRLILRVKKNPFFSPNEKLSLKSPNKNILPASTFVNFLANFLNRRVQVKIQETTRARRGAVDFVPFQIAPVTLVVQIWQGTIY